MNIVLKKRTDEFIQKTQKNQFPFSIDGYTFSGNSCKYTFVSIPVYNGNFIVGYSSEETDLDNFGCLAAIIANNTVYLYNISSPKSDFYRIEQEELKKYNGKVKTLGYYCNVELPNQIKNAEINFMNNLDVNSIELNDFAISVCKEEARTILIEDSTLKFPFVSDEFDAESAVSHLIGKKDLINDVLSSGMYSQLEYWGKEKKQYECILSFLQSPDFLQPWEREIIKVLKDAKKKDIKNLSVVFMDDGNIVESKIPADRFHCHFKRESSIPRYEFSNLPYSNGDVDCADILEIKFRGKTLYQKIS